MRIGIIAALPGELKPLVRGWQRMPVAHGSGIAMWQQQRNQDELIAVCSGMGPAAALRAFTAAEHAGSLDIVLSVGWAGATRSNFVPGSCFVFAEIIDAQTGERFKALGGQLQLKLVTCVRVADTTEKKRLWESYHAGMVDMEAATIARLAQMRDIPLVCFKAVSDNADADLPDLNPFIDVQGRLKMAAFLAYVALRPRYWSPLVYLGMHSAESAKAIAKAVNAFLVNQDLSEMQRLGEVEG